MAPARPPPGAGCRPRSGTGSGFPSDDPTPINGPVSEANEPILVVGRDESPGRRWTQAVVLGGLVAMFVAPALGFPMLSGGGRFDRFLGAVVGLWGVGTVAIHRFRPSRAVAVFADRVEWVDGDRRGAVPMGELRGARYAPQLGRLELNAREGPIRIALRSREGTAVVGALRRVLGPRSGSRLTQTSDSA